MIRTHIFSFPRRIRLFVAFVFCGGLFSAQAAELQSLDASISSSVLGNPVTQWTDQSASGNHALAQIGNVSFTGAPVFESGLPGLDFGPDRNSLELFSSAESDAWLDQTNGNGFCVFVALKVRSLGENIINDILGNTSGQNSGFFALRLTNNGSIRAFLGSQVVTQGGVRAMPGDSIILSFRYDRSTSEFRFWDSKNTSAAFAAV
ncbi:MAG: hypothetical protein AAGJ79_02060, partial [Verrucomicrobiota bacterium]